MKKYKVWKVRAWAMQAKEKNGDWEMQYQAHFIYSFAQQELKEFRTSNKWRKDLKFRIVPVDVVCHKPARVGRKWK